MQLSARRHVDNLSVNVVILRPGGKQETLTLLRGEDSRDPVFRSLNAPGEPHEFAAELHLRAGERREVLLFNMTEPACRH
jgi:hypothetical protein